MAVALKNWSLAQPWASHEQTAAQPAMTGEHTGEVDVEWDEQDLVRRAQTGDSEAFERLYETHVRRIYALCLRMLSEPSRAEEVTQDVFVRAWEKIPSFQFRSGFGTWLHRVAINVILGKRQKLAKQRDRHIDADEPFERLPARTTPEGLNVDFEAAIEYLPSGARKVFVLHDVEGYKHREIAEMLGVTTGTSKAQLHRARMTLRMHLEY